MPITNHTFAYISGCIIIIIIKLYLINNNKTIHIMRAQSALAKQVVISSRQRTDDHNL